MICPVDKIRNSKTKIGFWPKISKFWGHYRTFWSLVANWSRIGQCFRHERGVSLVTWCVDTKTFTASLKKIRIFGPKLTFLPKYWLFWSIWSYAWPKNSANKVPRFFSARWVSKLSLPPVKIRMFGPKTTKRTISAQNMMHFWSFWVIYWPLWSIRCHVRPIKQCKRGASVVFWYVGTRTFAPSQ